MIREDNLASTSYEAPAPMAAGNYRFWVKAINAADNTSGFWSEPTDFTIVNTEQFASRQRCRTVDATVQLNGNSLLASLLDVLSEAEEDEYSSNNSADLDMVTEQQTVEPGSSENNDRLESVLLNTQYKAPASKQNLLDEIATDDQRLDQLMAEELQLLNEV